MKLVQDFNAFLNDTVNLNSTRFDQLENSIEAIKTAVRGLDWKPSIIGFAAQGSWAHKTIIKPLPGDPFDADLLVYVKPVAGWEAKDYINELHAHVPQSVASFDRYGLRQIAWFVHIRAFGAGGVVCQQLQWDHVQDGA